MRLLIFFLFLQASQTASLEEVSANLGGKITLHSGANVSWKLTTIEWSIYTNNTWIATYQNENVNVERVSRYKGRLHLNTTTGDLTINNVTTKDAMDYTVELSSDTQGTGKTINLKVKKPLQNPTISTHTNPIKQACVVVLDCVSQDNGVNLSWHVNPTVDNITRANGSHTELFALIDTRENSAGVSFTCTSSKDSVNASTVVTLNCKDSEVTPPAPVTSLPMQTSRQRDGIYYLLTYLGGAATVVLIIVLKKKYVTAENPLCKRLSILFCFCKN
ncbi:uncharacterized protein LOC114436669 [Parambassis ranga]|uniref:Uncharacterized protein LOC114436669 n=1 Tax=Parambassis ranga TaxID=210632 RepID=A0A6P7I4F9_9TELE|nr:uncharacterized protein LOC114436669 [Parambassis ranga]